MEYLDIISFTGTFLVLSCLIILLIQFGKCLVQRQKDIRLSNWAVLLGILVVLALTPFYHYPEWHKSPQAQEPSYKKYNQTDTTMQDRKQLFKEWAERNQEQIFNTLKEANPEAEQDLKVGDKVMFTNEAGITFGPYEVLGFCKPRTWGGCVFVSKDSWWFPNKPEMHTKVEP